MRLVTYEVEHKGGLGVISKDGKWIYPLRSLDMDYKTMQELIEKFCLDRVSKSGAKFDYEKGKWFNHKYLQMKSNEELADVFQHFLVEKDIIEDSEKVSRVVGLIKERANFVTDLWDQSFYFFRGPAEYDEKSV